MTIVLGVDPSLSSTGFCLLQKGINREQIQYLSSGAIKTNSKEDLYKRLGCISSSISQIITEYKPSVIAIEETFVNTNYQTSLKLSIVRGVIIGKAIDFNLKIIEISPSFVKKTITGNGSADKESVKKMIKMLIKLPSVATQSTLDETDAVAIALTAIISNY